ncbi:hypothetical protein V6N13_012190 [Hibiscus sabdariffa]
MVVAAAAMIICYMLGGKEPDIGTYRRGINPHAVRRAPRVPVLYSYRRDGIERALQRGSSPQFSQKPYNKVECRQSTPVQSYDCTIQSVTTKAKLPSSSSEHWMMFWLGDKKTVIGTYRRDTCPLVNMESATTSEIHQKGKNYWEKVKVDEIMDNLSNDGGKVYGGTEEGITDTWKFPVQKINFQHRVRGRKARKLSREGDPSFSDIDRGIAKRKLPIVFSQTL